MSDLIKKLPTVFQTTPEKKFFDATFDQVFSKKDSEYLAGFIGRKVPGKYKPGVDFYIPEPSKDRSWWQLEPTAFTRDKDYQKTNIVFYQDLLNRIEYYGGNTGNHSRLFDSEYYSWAPPIDYDMFVNYHNYYWVDNGLPLITINGVTLEQIEGREYYFIPGTTIKLSTGMVIVLPDSNDPDGEYYVEIVNGVIRLVKKQKVAGRTGYQLLPWDGVRLSDRGDEIVNTIWDGKPWEVESIYISEPDLITIARGSEDGNVWSSRNRWIHIDVLRTILTYTNTEWPVDAIRGSRPIIQFNAGIELYRSGTKFLSYVKYAFVKTPNGDSVRLEDIQYKSLDVINETYGIDLEDNDRIIIAEDIRTEDGWLGNDSNDTRLTSYVFTVSVLQSGDVLLYPLNGWYAPVADGEVVYTTADIGGGATIGESWYYGHAGWMKSFNNGEALKTGPWFQLYDYDGVPLDDAAKYPDSSFSGSRIFSYKINPVPGATVDPVLKIPLVYRSTGQATDMMFENSLIVDRHVYGESLSPIHGYYYYRVLGDPVLKNGWELYTTASKQVDDAIYTAPRTSHQRVIDKFNIDDETYTFKLSVVPELVNDGVYDIDVKLNGRQVNLNGYTFEIINGQLYLNLSHFLSTNSWIKDLEFPILEVATYTTTALPQNEYGYFEIPQQLEANPNQEEVSELSGSELMEHFTSIIAAQPGLVGNAFGGTNNYRDTVKNSSLGRYILQNMTPALKSMLVTSEPDLDIVLAIRYAQDEYTKFKNRYVKEAEALINAEFNPVQYYNNTVIIGQWVDSILKSINVSKEFSKAFAYSFMAASGKPTYIETFIASGPHVILDHYLDLTTERNALYIYDNLANERLLVNDVDYKIVSTNNLIEVRLLNLSLVGKELSFVFYENFPACYIPATPAKLGMAPVYTPRIYTDYTYAEPVNVLLGHDGSKTVVFGDYRDQSLLEIETRIYNSINRRFRNEYEPPVRVEHVRSGFFRQTNYRFSEFLRISEQSLNKWCARNRASFRTNDWARLKDTVPTTELWRLYNYSRAEDTNGTKLDLPGNWRGIFEYLYDTIMPDVAPWQMLGFSDMPEWWVAEYGPGIQNSDGAIVWVDARMWDDLERGLIRRGPRCIKNQYTGVALPNMVWARPGLSQYMPIDAAGNLRTVIDIFNIAVTSNQYEPFDGYDLDWEYGDGAPVEHAWKSTSSYRYCMQEAMFLMRPAAFAELNWDTLGTELRIGRGHSAVYNMGELGYFNYQYVQNDLYPSSDEQCAWMRPKNRTQIVHAEIINGTPAIRYGYQQWISDRILFHGKDISETFGVKVRGLSVNLANKFAGFTNKDTVNTYIESVGIHSSTRTLGVPSTNFDVLLHKGQPLRSYAYSGVIIRSLANGEFAVYGYDLLNSQFTILERNDVKAIEVTVGGTPAEYRYFEVGAGYRQGDIVRYNGVYYVATAEHVSVNFNTEVWQKIPALPIVGGITVSYKPVSLATTRTYAYGSIFRTVQEVFDFLIGWGAYLEKQGWKFDEVNTDDNQVSDWLHSAKHFLFWLNSDWAPNATIQLSPLATQARLEVATGYPNNVELISNGVYSILDKRGVAIPVDKTVTERDGRTITVRPTDLASGGIFFLQVTASESEHILIFDNTTAFNDVVYSPLLRARQDRIRFNGFCSKGWYGKMEAPGYIVSGHRLIPNYDTLVSDMRYYYDPDTFIDNPNLEELGRRLIGFERKEYMDNLQISNDVQYLFYQGQIREKGTAKSLDKLFRSSIVNTKEDIEIFEEWALKVGDVGNIVGNVSTEFILSPEQYTGDTMVARLKFKVSTSGGVQEIRILNSTTRYSTPPTVQISAPDMPPIDSYEPRLFAPGYTYLEGSLVYITGAEGIKVYYRSIIDQKPDQFISENWERIPDIRPARAYAVLDTKGMLMRIDMTDSGYGYSRAPTVQLVSSGVATSDVVYAVWRGETILDESKDNIISIDVDDDEQWVVRPQEPGNALVFPTTEKIDYDLPNAGYVNMNDVDWMVFDINNLVINWGVDTFRPMSRDVVWVAKTFTEDWGVYKIAEYNRPWSLVKNISGNLVLLLDTSEYIGIQGSNRRYRTDLGNLICLQKIENGKVDSVLNYAVAIDPNYSVYIDNTTTTAYNAYTLVTLDNVPLNSADIGDYEEFNTLNLFRSLRLRSTPTQYRVPVYVGLGDYLWVDDHDGEWAVLKTSIKPGRWDIYRWSPEVLEYYGVGYGGERNVHAYGWDTEGPMQLEIHRKQEPLIDTAQFKNACIFAGKGGNTLVQLPVYDPFKGIIPGVARQNISYISSSDPARYNVTTETRLYTDDVEFLDEHVGKLWWDTSDTRYMYYEQPAARAGETVMDNLRYRRDNWGKLFPGSRISVYEWVKSPVPPTEYNGTGTPRDLSSFIQTSSTNIYTGVVNNHYYFWVKDLQTKPGIINRTLTAMEVANVLQSTRVRGNRFFSPIQQSDDSNAYMFFDVQDILSNSGRNVRIEYVQTDSEAQVHTQWSLFREGDVLSDVKDIYWNRLVDSICGYTSELTGVAPNNAVHINGAYVVPVPDPALSAYEKYGIRSRPEQSMFVDIYTARKILMQSLNDILLHIPVRDKRADWDIGISKNYWSYVTWYKSGHEDARPTKTRNTLTDAYISLMNNELVEGDIVEVLRAGRSGTDNRFSLQKVERVEGVLVLTEIALQDSAVKVSDRVYTTRNRYDLSTELRELLTRLKEYVFIGDYYIYRNRLFSAMLNYVLSEQRNPDWVFKTSMITIKEGVIELEQGQTFIPNQVEDIIDYITDTKPYHTHVREYTTVYSKLDVAHMGAKDSLKSKISLAFKPGPSIFSPAGWDTFNWDMYGWEKIYNEKFYDEVDVVGNTYAPSGTENFGVNPLISADVDTILASDEYYTVPLVNIDASKIGLSTLTPYTFEISSGVSPASVVGLMAGNKVLLSGIDFYIAQNEDRSYTAYLYSNPGIAALSAIVWMNGGTITRVTHPTYRSEYAFGYPADHNIMIVDTQLPVEDRGGVYYALTGWGSHWGSINPDSQLSKFIRGLNGLDYPYRIDDTNDPTNLHWDTDLSVVDRKIVLADYVASYRQTLQSDRPEQYMRNARVAMGVLEAGIERQTYANQHVQTLQVTVDLSLGDVLPDPARGECVIWIHGERIKYKRKVRIAENTWELSLLERGTDKTTAMRHSVMLPNRVSSGMHSTRIFVETGNLLEPTSARIAWNALGATGIPLLSTVFDTDKYTSISNQSEFGLWYAGTTPAQFIVAQPGKAII